MPVALTVTKRAKENRTLQLVASLVFSGTYPTNGDPLDLAAYNPLSSRQPDLVQIQGKAGFVYQYDPVNKKILVYTNTAGGANAALGEHTNATYVAGVSGDTVIMFAEWVA